jgi:hypothetical protein
MGELQMRQQLEQQNLADALQRAKIAHMISLTASRGPVGQGNAAQWRANLGGAQPGVQPGVQPAGRGGARGGKPAPYVPGSGDVQNDPSTDSFDQIRADFDAQHGAGSFNAFTKNMGNLMDDGKGNLVVGKSAPDPNDPSKTIQVPATDKNGLALFSIPKTDAPFWTNRYNAARIRSGQGYVGNLPDGINPNSGQPSGSQVNPIAVNDSLTLRSLPFNTWMQIQNPDGSVSVRQKLPQAVSGGGQQAAQPAAAPEQPQSPAEQQGAEQQLESEEEPTARAGAAGGGVPSQLAAAGGARGAGGLSPLMSPQMNLAMSGFQAPPATPPSFAGAGPAPDVGQIASANVSPTGAGQSYLQSLGLGAGAGQLYPAADLWS